MFASSSQVTNNLRSLHYHKYTTYPRHKYFNPTMLEVSDAVLAVFGYSPAWVLKALLSCAATAKKGWRFISRITLTNDHITPQNLQLSCIKWSFEKHHRLGEYAPIMMYILQSTSALYKNGMETYQNVYITPTIRMSMCQVFLSGN